MPYSATYLHGSSTPSRRHTVKKGNLAVVPAESGWLATMVPMVTPRSPLDATMTRSGAQLTELPLSGSSCDTTAPIESAPTTNAARAGPPMFTASLRPYWANALFKPICWASREKARSAVSRLWRNSSMCAWSLSAATSLGGNAGSIATGSAGPEARPRLYATACQPPEPFTQYVRYLSGVAELSGATTDPYPKVKPWRPSADTPTRTGFQWKLAVVLSG